MRMRSIVLRAIVGILTVGACLSIGIAAATTVRDGVTGSRLRSCELPVVKLARGTVQSCLKRELRRATRDDVVGGMRALARYELHAAPAFKRSCHILMHGIGRDIADRSSLKSLARVDAGSSCVDGFLHGGLEGYLQRAPSVDGETVSELFRSGVCPDSTLLRVRTCQHGVGHVIARRESNRLPESLASCAALEPMVVAHACSSGVMMEYQFGLLGIDGSTRLSVRGVRRDPGAACTNVDSAFQPDCLAWMGDMLTDSSKRARYCAALESADARTLCLRRTGYITKLDPSKCADRDACWFGRIVSQGGSKEFEADVLSSCPKAGEPGARGCALAAGYVFEMRTERSRSIDPRCAAAFSHAAQRDTCEDGAVEARTAPLFY